MVNFVPNLTFGPDLLKGFKKAVDMVMDVHIMVDNPDMVAEIFAKAGADVITFHLEAVKDVDACIQLCRKIREMGVQAGVSVKPKTGVDALLAHLKEMDLVLIMSVEPGFGGQSFMEDTLEKVRVLRERIEKEGLNTRIEIDGGINGETAKLVDLLPEWIRWLPEAMCSKTVLRNPWISCWHVKGSSRCRHV